MDRLDSMRVFLAVADAGGFGAAARRLVLSPAAVTRAVAALESRIGTRLLHRTTRSLRLTEAGERYREDCRRILAEIAEAEASAAGAHAEPRGTLTVTAPLLFGRMHVAPVILDFLARHPALGIRLLLLDRVVDMLEEGIDVAIRIAHLPDSGMSALRVGSVRRVLAAAPAYLAAQGEPHGLADLDRLDAIGFAAAPAGQPWLFTVNGRTSQAHPRMQLVANTAEVAIAAALAGRGVIRVLSYQIAAEVADGRLRILLAEHEPPPIPIHIVHPEGRRASARVRAFVDFAAARLRERKIGG